MQGVMIPGEPFHGQTLNFIVVNAGQILICMFDQSSTCKQGNSEEGTPKSGFTAEELWALLAIK
jgi:hypothetical protein